MAKRSILIFGNWWLLTVLSIFTLPQGGLSLVEGDVVLVGMQTAGSDTAGVGYDSFTFVTLVDLAPGTRIYFTDTNCTGNDFVQASETDYNGREGLGFFEVKPGYTLRAGTVVSSANTSDDFFVWKTVAGNGNVGELAAGQSLLDFQTAGGDQIYAFQSTASLTSPSENPLDTTSKQTHLSALGTHNKWSYTGSDSTTSALPQPLDRSGKNPTVYISSLHQSGATFFNLSVAGNGPRTRLEWLDALEAEANWSGNNSGAFTLPTTSFSMLGGLNLTWNTGSGAWDASAANWKDAGNNITRFLPKDHATFGGSNGGAIGVDAAGVSAGNVVINHSAGSYTFTGGLISATSLQKLNSGAATINNALNLSGDVTVNGGTLTLAGSNTYTKTVLNGGTLIAAHNAALGAGSIIFNGGALASDNDSRVIANPLVVNNAAGNTISGANSLSLTGGATGPGALSVAFDDKADSVTVSGAQFAPGQINLSKGSLILGNSNVLGDTTRLALAGGTLKTEGFSDSVGVLTLSFDSVIDLGTGSSVLQFASSRGETWSGILQIDNWSGNPTGGGADRVIFGTDFSDEANAGLSDFQRNQIFFLNPDGYAPGFYTAKQLQSGEVVPGDMAPVPEPSTLYAGAAVLVFILSTDRHRRIRRRT